MSDDQSDQMKTATEQKWAAYNRTMAALFAERDQHALDSSERTAAAEKILALWYAAGS